MSDILSQAEIDALLNNRNLEPEHDNVQDEELSLEEIDTLGEIGNICMGASATTLSTLLGQKVTITTPKVSVTTWERLAKEYTLPYVSVRVEYIKGLVGSNLLILNKPDVRIITDLMMGGAGVDNNEELTDLHLSAISEAMNQMIGSSATSMSSMFGKRIEISPPKAFILTFSTDQPYGDIDYSQKIVKIAFKMVIGNLLNSQFLQLLPISFAKKLVDGLLNSVNSQNNDKATIVETPKPENFEIKNKNTEPEKTSAQTEKPLKENRQVNVQPVHFQEFAEEEPENESNNISLIMDVPLEVTVELGRTHKLIKEVLEFSPGSIIELDKLAGEPVDILVNGKAIAHGEVVVIDESFGVRITDIIHPSKRL
ncbi:MAG TPA: flagellar motor switch phosphatase FliY [Clostridiaceae bacterium]|nr:flagellar motor switch phosphatase FliY [Clostridiaceae bacterium]